MAVFCVLFDQLFNLSLILLVLQRFVSGSEGGLSFGSKAFLLFQGFLISRIPGVVPRLFCA